jgi:hypothetical protein
VCRGDHEFQVRGLVKQKTIILVFAASPALTTQLWFNENKDIGKAWYGGANEV